MARLTAFGLGAAALAVSEPLLFRLHGALFDSARPLAPSSDWGVPLLLWAATLAVFAVVGIAAAHSTRPRSIVWWAATVGLVYGITRYAIYNVRYVAGDTVAIVIFAGCILAAPALGLLAGTIAYESIATRRR